MKKVPFILYLIAGILITITSLYGYSLYCKRIGLPPEIKQYYEKNMLAQIDDIKIKTEHDDEFILCNRKAGESASFYIRTDKGIIKKQGNLVSFYSHTPYPLITLIIGIFLIILAFMVFLLRPQELRARIFYLVSLLLACAQTVNGGFYCVREAWLSYVPGILFFISYALVPALLLHFSLTFLRPKLKTFDYLIYVPAVFFIIVLVYLFLLSSSTSSIEAYRYYQSVLFFFRCFVVLYILASFFTFVLSYKKIYLEEQRAQIKWILYGLFFGVGPLIFLYQLPLILIKRSFISEEFAGVFLIFIPIALAISIIRFKLMNIELIINRSLVYSILTVFTASVYLIFVQVSQSLFSKLLAGQQATISVLGVLAAAVAFNPARKKIQEFVDRSFFRLSYDYKKSILSFNERAHNIIRQAHLVDFFLAKVNKTIPLKSTSLMIFSIESGKQKRLIEGGEKTDLMSSESQFLGSDRIFAKRKSVSTELGLDFSLERLLEEKHVDLVIPLPFRTSALTGFFALGGKRSGAKFSGEDIELLLTMVETFALNFERINLQEEVIYERAEKEKLDEMNRLKTEFISNVSHEIRTPMSSIYTMTEILHEGKIKGKGKKEEILSLMADECGRLSRFLHNILDYGKIEQNATVFNFQKTDVAKTAEDMLRLYAYRFESLGFSVKKHGFEHPVWLIIDQDAIKQVLTNLIDNAIKYSSEKREIIMTIKEGRTHTEIRIQDKGVGIPVQEHHKIFKGFYRVSDAQKLAPKGVGLGLKIVKHIMEAHGGYVRVASQPGRGSTFSLFFPK
jgi:signal transduction histidine kinase